jgi:hypothetical protein
MNWIIPNKFIAFMGPVDNKKESRGNQPEDYLQVFKHFGVTNVVRLNEAKYDRNKFIKAGIKHHDLFFIDGSTPSDVSFTYLLIPPIVNSQRIHEDRWIRAWCSGCSLQGRPWQDRYTHWMLCYEALQVPSIVIYRLDKNSSTRFNPWPIIALFARERGRNDGLRQREQRVLTPQVVGDEPWRQAQVRLWW